MTQVVKRIYRGVTSYLQYWRGNKVVSYQVMEPWAEYSSFNLPSSVDGDIYSKWNTFKYCHKVKVTLKVATASTNNQVHVYITYRNGTRVYLGSTDKKQTISMTVDAQDIRIRYNNNSINTAYGQVGTVTFEPMK